MRVFNRALDLDSGLGSSVQSDRIKDARREVGPTTIEDDSLAVADLIQGWLTRCISMELDAIDTQIADTVNTSETGHSSSASDVQSAIVRSISPASAISPLAPNLSNLAGKKFADNVLHPLLREDRFKPLHPLVSFLGSRINKTIKCLRDLEQSLIFEPLVRSALVWNRHRNAYFFVSIPKRLAISHSLYQSFGEFSVQLVLDTFNHLSESEQRRSSDRPYDNGYFLDLVQQVGRLAAQVGAARRARSGTGEGPADLEEMDYSPYDSTISPSLISSSHHSRDDDVTLEGGLSQTGRPAELVRWKNGEGHSLRTNERYEPQPAIKRQRSNESLDDEAERSMARRKKNAEPKIVKLRCSDRSCDKIFNRKCDLAKHEKTHSRPYKCPETTCKYHEQGLPTEKELDRHINDKHSANPRYYHCQYCPFKTKRDSNCKQHMEKKHGWTYDRVKGTSKSLDTPQQTPQTPSIYTPSVSTERGHSSTNGSDASASFSPFPSRDATWDSFQTPANPYQVSLFPQDPPLQAGPHRYGSPEFNFNSPYFPTYLPPTADSMGFISPTRYEQNYQDTPLTPIHPNGHAVDITPSDPLHIGIDYQGHNYSGLPTPDSHSLVQHSRNPSISEANPITPEDGLFHSIQQTVQPTQIAMSHSYSGVADLPSDDFALFAASGDPSTVRSTADLSYEPMDLFGDVETEYSDSQLGRYLNI